MLDLTWTPMCITWFQFGSLWAQLQPNMANWHQPCLALMGVRARPCCLHWACRPKLTVKMVQLAQLRVAVYSYGNSGRVTHLTTNLHPNLPNLRHVGPSWAEVGPKLEPTGQSSAPNLSPRAAMFDPSRLLVGPSRPASGPIPWLQAVLVAKRLE